MARTADEVVVDVIANVAKANADLKQYAKTSEKAFADAATAQEKSERKIAESVKRTADTVKKAANQNTSTPGKAANPVAGSADEVAKALKDAADAAKKTKEELADMGGGASVSTDALGDLTLASAAAAIAVGGLTFALDQAYAALAYADELEATSKKLNTTAERLQELQFAAQSADVSNSSLVDGLENLNTALGSVVNGTASKQTVAVFKALGFTRDQLKSIGDASNLLPILADKIGAISSEAQRADIAKRLGIEDLVPLLEKGSKGLDDAAGSARKLGTVLDNQTVKSVAELNDRLEVAQKRIDVQLKAAFINITPFIVGFTEAVAGGVQALNEFDRKSMAVQNGLLGVQAGIIRPENMQNYINAQLYDGGAVGGGRGRRGGIRPKGQPFSIPKTERTGSTRNGTLAASQGAQAALDQAATEQARALAGLTQDIRSKADAQKAALDADLKATIDGLKAKQQSVNADKTITAAKKAEINAQLDQAATIQTVATAIKKRGVDAEAEIDLAEKALSRRRTIAGLEIQRLQSEAQLAKTTQERAVIEGRILDIQKGVDDQARANKRNADQIRANAVSPGTIVVASPAEQNAADAADLANRELLRRAGLSPLERWKEDSIKSIQEVQNAYEELTVRGIDGFNQSLADAIVNGKNFGDIFGSILKKIAADFLILKLEGLEGKIFGAGKDGESGGFFSDLFRARGGPVRAGQPYIVGEKRPEVFVPDVAGRIIPSVSAANRAARGSGMGGGSSGGGNYYDLTGALVTQDLLDQMNAMNRASSSKTLAAANKNARKSFLANQQSAQALGT